MLATLVLSLLVFTAANSTGGSFQGATIEITDLGSCTGCVGGITRAMKRIDGVVDAALEEGSTIQVTAEDGVWIDPDELRDIVRNAGYTAGTVASVCRGTLAKKEGRAFFTAASAPEEESLAIEDPEELISEAVTGRAHFVSTDSSPTPVLRVIDD
jgi:copper chaperone CopZ